MGTLRSKAPRFIYPLASLMNSIRSYGIVSVNSSVSVASENFRCSLSGPPKTIPAGTTVYLGNKEASTYNSRYSISTSVSRYSDTVNKRRKLRKPEAVSDKSLVQTSTGASGNWVRVIDKKTNMPYYWNTETDETTAIGEVPPGFPPEQVAPIGQPAGSSLSLGQYLKAGLGLGLGFGIIRALFPF